MILKLLTSIMTSYLLVFLQFQVDPANIEGLKSRLEQKDKEICALKQAAKVCSKKSVVTSRYEHQHHNS